MKNIIKNEKTSLGKRGIRMKSAALAALLLGAQAGFAAPMTAAAEEAAEETTAAGNLLGGGILVATVPAVETEPGEDALGDEPGIPAQYLAEGDREVTLVQRIAEADNRFGKKLMAKLAGSGENVFISPYSIATVLSMLGHCSSEGEQIEELYEQLGYTELTQEEILSGQEQLIDSLISYYAKQMSEEEKEENGIGTVEIANALYVNDLLELLPEFETVKGLLAGYQADVEEKALYTQEAVDDINAWVKEKTHEMIDSILNEPLGEDAALLLLNTVYFKGNWNKDFAEEATDTQTFYGTNGETEISMMHLQDRFSYAETDEYQIIRLPYRDTYQMVVYLPKDANACSQWSDEEYLTVLTETPYEFGSQEVILSMPKFELEYDVQLKSVLKEIGLTKIFEGQIYDRVSTTELKANEILHKTALKNDEKGTEASAVTAALIATMSMPMPMTPVEMTIDRPFYFTITHQELGLNLFEGCILNLE